MLIVDEQQQKIRCDCGQVVAKYALSHHLRSILHKNWLSDGCFKKFTIVDDEVNKHVKIQYRDKDGNHKSITKRYLRCGYDAAYEAIVAKQAELIILEYGTQ